MTDNDIVLRAKINYYCREKFYQSMQNAALEGLKKFTGDPVYKWFFGLSLTLEGRVQEAIRELDPLQHDSEVGLGVLLALIFSHRRCRVPDKQMISQLDTKLKEERKKANEKALYYAGLFLFHTGKYDKAREYIDRMIKLSPSYREGMVIKGWVELMNSKESRDVKGKTAVQYFDNAINSSDGRKDIDALFGKAKYFELKNNFSGALELLNQVVALLPAYLPAIIEKMKMQLALQDWEQTIDMANRALNMDGHCLEAQRFRIIHLICREGNYDETASKLSDFFMEMENNEPKNANLFYETAQLFCRLCGRHSGVLTQTFQMAERAVQLDDQCADYVTELGYQCVLQGKIRDAVKFYKNATKLDGNSVTALTGIVSCQLMEDQLDTAEQQLEFLREVQMSLGPSSELLYLHAVLARKRNKSPEEVICLLDESVHSHSSSFKGLPLGIQYLLLLNPDFLVLIVKEYLKFAPTQPINPGQVISPVLKQCLAILDPVTRACPGMLDGLYLMARVKYLTGDIKAASSTLQHIIDNVSSTFSDAYLLLAQINLHQDNFKQASHYLEVGLSYNFEVRDHPLYHLIKAQVQKKQGELGEALKTLQIAMTLTSKKGSSVKKSRTEISVTDQVSVSLELADAYRLLDKQHEATSVLQDALSEFQGTSEEVRIIVANADLALARGDVEHALTMLRAIGSEQPYYMQAREKMADIYLNHKKDKRLFASCYREIVERFPRNVQAYLLLGDAYMNIQEPELAIEVYEKALKENPKDTTLASKIGQALVKTHNYGKAINYYKEALKNEDQGFLRYDLAELLLRLRQYEKAEKVLCQALEQSNHGSYVNDLSTLIMEVKVLVLLAQVYQRTGNHQNALTTLAKAKEGQSRVLKRVQVEQPDALAEERNLASSICCQMAEHVIIQRDFDKAISFYKEAIACDDTNSQAMLDLAHLHMMVGDLEACQQVCSTLLRSDKENDSATIMMANLNFYKNDYDTAMFHFQQLLDRKPDYYEALSRLIELMRRMGRLEEVPHYLEQAEHASARSSMEPGFSYCKAQHEWYTGNPNTALKLFNKARKDNEWGQRAIRNMIEICLNPDNDTLGGETFDNMDSDTMQYERQDSQELAIRTADKLLKELKTSPGDIEHLILTNFLLLSTKQKAQAERALNEFLQISSNELYRDHVGAILGIATAYMILKQTPRARNQLKRVAKNAWNFEDAEYLEHCWLLLADIYIQSGKFDMATELLRRVLQHNKSSCKAYEYMGYIMEKEQSYRDAAANYENAWKYGNRNNPVIGYKLAFNYMKAKRYVDAIDVCHCVLAKHPNYPKIRKDILEKSRANLRI